MVQGATDDRPASPTRWPRAPIVCLEGPSAAGKTTLAQALAAEHGAAVVPELVATGAPAIPDAEPWFTERHVERWREAERLADAAPLVVIDCDPLKGLWYNWMHAEEGWPGIDVVGPLYRDRMWRGLLGVPDLYVYLDASEAELRARRAGDATRARRGFEMHVRKRAPQRRYFAALHAEAPGLVAFLDTADRASLPARVAALARSAGAKPPDALPLLERMIAWVRTHPPEEGG